MEPVPLLVDTQSPNHWTGMEFPYSIFKGYASVLRDMYIRNLNPYPQHANILIQNESLMHLITKALRFLKTVAKVINSSEMNVLI